MSSGNNRKEALDRFNAQKDGSARRSWSNGRVGPEDDGDLAIAIGKHPKEELVMIDFGKQVSFIGMPPQQAIDLAMMIVKHAKSIATEPVTVNLF